MSDTAVYEIKVKLNDEQMREIRAIRAEAIDRAVRVQAMLAVFGERLHQLLLKNGEQDWEPEYFQERVNTLYNEYAEEVVVEHALVEVRADQYVQLTNGKYTTSIILDEAPTSGLAMLIMLGDEA